MIYFAQVKRFMADRSGLVKIGWSKNPERRIASLKTAMSDDLVIIRLLAGRRSDEKRIHREVYPLQVRREWFRYEPELLSYDFGLPDIPTPEACPVAMFAEAQPAVTRLWKERRKAQASAPRLVVAAE
jgi:hypothetical protein